MTTIDDDTIGLVHLIMINRLNISQILEENKW